MKKEGIIKLGFILMAVCLISALGLFAVNQMTRDNIEHQAASARLASLKVVLPEAHYFSRQLTGRKIDYYTGFNQHSQPVGYAFIGSSWGYSSTIVVMAGIDLNGRLTGIDVLEEKETPGLGDEVVHRGTSRSIWDVIFGKPAPPEAKRPWFQAQFAGKDVSQLVVVKDKDPDKIESLTGATITSRAVTRAVKKSIENFLAQKKDLTGGGR